MNTVCFDLDKVSERYIYNSMKCMCIWNIHQYDNAHVGNEPDGFIKNMYPYLEYLILMTFTGGKKGNNYNNWYTEDEYGNPSYDFSQPIEIINNVLRGGVKPFIVLGQVPNDLSKKPEDYGEPSTLWGNRYAPKDYKKYYNYMLTFANTLVEEYGKEEISTWKFRFMTEWDDYERATYWWKENLEEYLKLYDYTVAALTEAIGKDNFCIGIGNVTRLREYPIKQALEHCENGINYYTGKLGTKCDHISISKYFNDFNVESVGEDAAFMNNLIENYPLLNISEVGYGEGGIIFDSNGDRLHMCQGITEEFGSATARMFIIANENKSQNAYFANWEYLTDKNNYDIDFMPDNNIKTPAAYTAELCAKMLGAKVIPSTNVALAKNISVIGAVDIDDSILRVLICNHPYDEDHNNTVKLDLNITPTSVKQYIVDKNHGNFSRTWLKDSKNLKRKHIKFDINTEGSSILDSCVSLYLDEHGFNYWQSKKPYYQEISSNIEIKEILDFSVADNHSTFCIETEPYSVSLLEIYY